MEEAQPKEVPEELQPTGMTGLDISCVQVVVEFERRAENGKLAGRGTSEPAVVFAANIPEMMLHWIKTNINFQEKR